MDLDRMIEDLARERRHRSVLIVTAVIGIVAGAMLGLIASLGGIRWATGGYRNPGALIFFVAPFVASMTLGYAIYGALRWFARPRVTLPRATLRR